MQSELGAVTRRSDREERIETMLLAARRVGGYFSDVRQEDLDRDLSIELRVTCAINGTHATLAKHREDLVGAAVGGRDE